MQNIDISIKILTITGSVKSVLDTVDKAQLSSEQLQSVVNSLLAIASEGGWSETRKTADSAHSRKLEEAQAKLLLQEVTFFFY